MHTLEAGAAHCAPADGLAGLLSPLTEQEFLRDRLGTEPVVIRGREGRFRGLFGWSRLNELLASTRTDASRIHLVRSADGVPLASCAEPVPQLSPRGRPSRLRPERLYETLHAGSTLAIDGVEELHAPLRALVTAVEGSLRSLVQANLYVNLGGAPQGFHTHWDDHDVLVLQAEGAKHWDIHPPTEEHPVGVLSDPPPPAVGAATWSGDLTEGDVLYLPRGWWHTVRAVEGRPSLHLTLGTRLPSAGDLLRRLLVHLARSHPLVRQDLPRFAAADRAQDWYAALREVLVTAAREPGLLEELAERAGGGAPHRPQFTLPDTAGTR
ncbi:cupin domain-containing protein [Streptosporangium nondiastaticum]|uniref:cupin domain-containing protein n=1 Tax=Streptosporangium nondiastaticum TaxID=35764 RepID=UPI0016730972|nr:cupin domain-containing protein [Streptosporangium nondiastaticum]